MKILPARCLWIPIAAAALLLTACNSPSPPTGDRLVSVSWVNSSPEAFTLVRTTLCGDGEAVLEPLPPYQESAVTVDLPLLRSCRVETVLLMGGETVHLPAAWIPAPTRLSPDRRYHLRVRLRADAATGLVLEPAEAARARLRAATGAAGVE
jgi:hypothetical protein